VHFIVGGQNHLQRSGAFRSCDQCTGTGGGKLDTASKQCLDAGSRSNNEEFEVNTFFPHVTFLLRNRIDDVLKVFPSDCHVDGIETRRLCSKEEENNAHDPKDAAPSVPPRCVCHPVSLFSEVNENPDTPLVQIMNWYN
jgi:hypothetical protein